MKSQSIVLAMIILILVSTLSVTTYTPQVAAKDSVGGRLDEAISETANTNQVIQTNESNKSSRASEDFTNLGADRVAGVQDEILDVSRQASQDRGDRWDFNDTSGWSDFAYVEGNMTRLVIGANREKLNSYRELEKITAKHQAKIVNTISIRGEIRAVAVELPLRLVTAFVEELRIVGLASYIEPSMKVQAQLVPNDPYWSSQWGPQKIEADWAWNTTLGSPSVLVAVVDTGIDYTHPDLAANYVPLGYDWVNNDPDPRDDHGHGTHVSGTIAAVINNSIGIAGLANVRVMGEKVLDSGGSGYWEWVASGIIHAVNQSADIISMSLGGYGHSELVYEAIRYAYDSGVLVIAAAGNDNTSMKLYPAGYDEVVAVVATDQGDNKAGFSNWGSWVELAAPGVDIYSTVPWGYVYASGTSMATPHVSGVAALVWSLFPNKTRDWVRLWLRYTSGDLGDQGFDVYYGYGRINARKAVEQGLPNHELIAYEWETPPYVEPTNSATVNATVLNFGELNESDVVVQLLVNDIIIDSASISFVASGQTAAISLTWNPTVVGVHNVTLYVVPGSGETSVENNVLQKYIYVGVPVKAVVLHSAGNIYGEIITNWQVLNTEWPQFGDTMVHIDYATLNKDAITYEDIVASEADVLIISCAYDSWMGWQFTDSEIEAIKRYVFEGHGLIVTAGTFYNWVPNNNKLAPLFGLNEMTTFTTAGTDLLHLLNITHPLFRDVPNPFVFADVTTAIPNDRRWDSNELAGGAYVAMGQFRESTIVTYRGLVYISPWLEVIPPYYHHHLQLFYNALMWSRYQKPEHEVVVSLEAPKYLEPGDSALLNATVSNMGLNNETNVELYLLIDDIVVNSTTVAELRVGASYRIEYLWIPSAERIYNLTAYAPQVPNEELTANNVATRLMKVRPIRGFVLFDQTHGTDSITSYSIWIANLTDRGYIVETHLSGSITPTVLEGYNVFIIPQARYGYTSEELSGIQNFVLGGGGLLVIGDDYPWIYTSLTSFADITWDYYSWSGFATDITPHQVTTGVASVYIGAAIAKMYVTEAAQDLVRDPYRNIMLAVSEAGFGKLLGVADESSVDNGSILNADNLRLANNMIDWFVAPRQEHDLAVSLIAPAFLELDNSALLNVTVRNRGLNNETDVELYLLINGTVVSSVMIPELLVDASYTTNYQWTPTRTGNHNITAYASPVPEEENIANNVVARRAYVFFYMRLDLPHEWVDGGVPMGWNADDASWAYDLPFDFPFYGTYYRTVYISSNGLITFTGPDSSLGSGIPELALRYAVAPAWDDWMTNQRPGDDIYIWQPDSKHIVIRWQVVAFYDRGTEANFEAILGSDGIVQMNYGYNSGSVSATIGISNGVGHYLAEDVTDLNYIDTIVFSPFPRWHDVAIINVTPSMSEVLVGDTVDITVVAENQGSFTENFNVTAYASSLNSTKIYFDPSNYLFDAASVYVGYKFNVTVKVHDVLDLVAWEVRIYYNDTIINVTRWFEPTWDSAYVFYGRPTLPLPTPPNATYWHLGPGNGSVMLASILFPWPETGGGFTGDGLLLTVEFEITAVPLGAEMLFSDLIIDNKDTFLLDSGDEVIPDVNKENGYYALRRGGPSPPPPKHYRIGAVTIIGLAPDARVTLTFNWNTTEVIPRVYLIWAEASAVRQETDIADNDYVDGIIRVTKPPSASFTHLPVFPKPGETVAFDATSSSPNGGTIISYLWDFGDDNITVITNPIVIHTYDFSGLYNVTLTITDSEGLTASTRRTIYVFVRDIALVGVIPSANWTYIGRTISINVTMLNEGEVTETFDVILYYNITSGDIIGTQIVIDLPAGEYRTLTFLWNTTGVKPCSNYTITAYAIPVFGETDVVDNTFSSSVLVKVKLVGDINGDGKVNIRDISIVSRAFGSYPGHPRWDPEADLDQDNKVNIRDLSIVARNYGKVVS